MADVGSGARGDGLRRAVLGAVRGRKMGGLGAVVGGLEHCRDAVVGAVQIWMDQVAAAEGMLGARIHIVLGVRAVLGVYIRAVLGDSAVLGARVSTTRRVAGGGSELHDALLDDGGTQASVWLSA
jgi:hypothetical protein